MQPEDYAEKRRKMDRWFEIHGHLECDSCNPHPSSKRKKGSTGRRRESDAAVNTDNEPPLGGKSAAKGRKSGRLR